MDSLQIDRLGLAGSYAFENVMLGFTFQRKTGEFVFSLYDPASPRDVMSLNVHPEGIPPGIKGMIGKFVNVKFHGAMILYQQPSWNVHGALAVQLAGAAPTAPKQQAQPTG